MRAGRWKHTSDLTPRAGVILLTGDFEKVILVRNPRSKRYDLPRGKIYFGEHIHGAARRDCLEATGYDVGEQLAKKKPLRVRVGRVW